MKQWITIAGTAVLMILSVPAGAWVTDSAPELLPTPLVRQAIDQDPYVVEARRALAAAGHGAAALRSGRHEWTTRAIVQSRRYDAGGRSNEWEAGLERALRIGGKARLDGDIGEVEIAFAQESLRAVESRRKAGDASVLDVNLATTDLVEMDRHLSAAGTAEAKAHAKLNSRFPLITELPKLTVDP